MDLTFSQWTLLAFSAIAGLVLSASPDHWVPASLLSWQRGWRGVRHLALPLLALAFHVALGFALFVAVEPWVRDIDLRQLFTLSAGLVVFFGLLRALQFPRIHRLFVGASRGGQAVLSVFLFLGPCEILFPILMKAKALGMGYLLPISAFSVASAVAGLALHLNGRRVWNAPLRLVQTLAWAQTRTTAIPMAAAALVGIALLVRL